MCIRDSANLMIIHRLSDLEAVGNADSEARALALGLLADCSTKIIYQQESSEAPHTAQVLGLSVTERGELPDLARGEGLWRVGQRAFVVRHLVTPGELELFDTSSRMLGSTICLDLDDVFICPPKWSELLGRAAAHGRVHRRRRDCRFLGWCGDHRGPVRSPGP